jgi:hypothetical protein
LAAGRAEKPWPGSGTVTSHKKISQKKLDKKIPGSRMAQKKTLNFFGGIFRERKREERRLNPVSTGLLARIE